MTEREALFEALDAERERRPAMQETDAVKYLFQAMCGMGHLLGSGEAVSSRLRAEMASLPPLAGEALAEPIGADWFRLNLRPARELGFTPEMIARMMLAAPPRERRAADRETVLRACAEWAQRARWKSVEEAAQKLLEEDWLPSHSPAYRAAYQPAYRVLDAAWLPCLPALCRALEAARHAQRCLVTLDGPCAGGKTTLAARLAAALGAQTLHTDDFVVPHAAKTAQRLAQPGGNCDWERLTEETLRPWLKTGEAEARRYSCSRDAFLAPEKLRDGKWLLLEGSYSGLPAIRELADVRLFLWAPEETRMRRLRERESPASLKRFEQLWIPLEEAYFRAYDLPDEGSLIIKEESAWS